MPPNIKLNVRKIDFVSGRDLPLAGTLHAAVPSRNKPGQVSDATWCSEILSLALQRGKAYIAIPESFWPKGSDGNADWQRLQGHPLCIPFPDLPDGQTDAGTPQDCIGNIVTHLKDGDDVLILSATPTISGFIPAILTMLAEPHDHVEKVLWPIEHTAGYGLTPAQRGYLAGLYDAGRLRTVGLDIAGAAHDVEVNDAVAKTAMVVSTESLRLLEQQIQWTTDQLSAFSDELSHEISGELLDITNFLAECEAQSGVNITAGGMASIGYRLCAVFMETSRIGLEAGTSLKCQLAGFASQSLEARLAGLRTNCAWIAERLARIYDSTMTFIECDLHVLQGHPEIADNAHLVKAVKLIHDQISGLFARVDEIRVAALEIHQAAPLREAPCKKDRDWAAVQHLLAACLLACKEAGAKSAARWSDQAMAHPKPGESGEVVTIKHPTKPGLADAWHHAHRSAIFVPGGKVPKALNGVPVIAWRDPPRTVSDWNASALLMPDLDEPALPASSLPVASGVVVVEPDGRIWLVSPTNRFGGYETTFPKGKRDAGMLTLQANAIKEGYEESGLMVRITGYLGDYKRTTSITRLYLAERVGGAPTDMGWESQAVRLVPPSEWATNLQNPSDKPVLAALIKYFATGS